MSLLHFLQSSLEPSTHMSSVNGDMKSRVSSFVKRSMRKPKSDEYNVMKSSKSTENIQMISSNKINNGHKADIPKINVTPTEQQTKEESQQSFTKEKEIEIKKEDKAENNDTTNDDENLESNIDSNITQGNINKGYDDVIDDDKDLKKSNSNTEQDGNTTNSNIEQVD